MGLAAARRRLMVAGAGVVALTVPALAAGTPALASVSSGAGAVTVVASGLNNPRGLAFAPNGRLYVAEAGTGGPDCVAGGEEGEICVGMTGSISRVSPGSVVRVVTGLVSAASRDGSGAEGAVAVSLHGQGGMYVQFGGNTLGLPVDQFSRADAAAIRAYLGQIAKASPGGAVHTTAGVGDADYRWSEDHKSLNPQFPDANPNGLLALPGRQYVVDAGANTLDQVDANGRVTVLSYFPVPADAPADAVPTCVAQGPDGALYVGELLGGYYSPGKARIWRVVPGQAPQVWQTGFSAINGCGFDRAGNFYATEFQSGGLTAVSPAGDVVKVTPSGVRTVLGTGRLFTPSGFAAGPDGAVYVSNWSILPGSSSGGAPTGQVVRLGTS
jgi:sugar lactone lactonase YvrE